jgi:hypothetical protein
MERLSLKVNILKRQWYLINPILVSLALLGAVQIAQGLNLEPSSPAADCHPIPRPYRATYDVYRNGKLLGKSVSVLSRAENGQWQYQVSMEATKGMGGLLGGEIHESARFTMQAGVLQPEHYDLNQKVAFSKIRRNVEFDWAAKRAQGKNKKKDWQLALQGDEIDRLSANIRIRQHLAAGKTLLSFTTVEKGELKVRDFEALEAETVTTVLGDMLAIPVHRKHSNSKRTTVIWHAPELGYLPVRVEHAKQGDDSGKLILTEYQQQACNIPATGQLSK